MIEQEISDGPWLEGIRSGNEEMIRLLVHRYQDKVLRLAYIHTHRWQDSEEIAQEVFVKIYRNAGTFRGAAKLSTWVYRITVNECIDFLRKQKRRPWLERSKYERESEKNEDALEKIRSSESTRADAENKEIKAAIDKAVRLLPEKQRAVFTLFYLESLKIEEISEILKVSEGNIKAQLWQARQKLKKELTPFFGADSRRKI